MDSDADIELPADWQEGVATFLAAFAETETLSLDQLLPSKLEPDGHPAFLPVQADAFATAEGHFDAASLTPPAEVACPYLKTSSPTWSASMFGEGVATPSSLELPGNSGGSRTRAASSSLESDEMKGRISKAAALADVKKQKLREKNRRAQQTYRNKQKVRLLPSGIVVVLRALMCNWWIPSERCYVETSYNDKAPIAICKANHSSTIGHRRNL